jgi:hypothetical protein
VGIDVINLVGHNVCAPARGEHRGDRRISLRLRLRQMVKIRGGAVADNFAENFRAPLLRLFECFQHDDRSAFAECETIALRVERAALSG